MTTYGLTPNGFTIKPFANIRAEVEEVERLLIDAGLSLSDDTSLGGVNVAFCNQVAELWETLQALYASRDPDTADEWSLVQLCKLTGTRPSDWSKTIVRDVEVTLNPDKSLPAGSVANLSGRPNTRFVSMSEVPADSNGGTFLVDFESVTPGSITVAPGQLNEISVAVSGWTDVSNTLSGETGTQPESLPALREKRERELEAAGSGIVDAIVGDVSRLAGVVDVAGKENTSTRAKNGLPGNSFHIIVRGGTAQAIAQQIYDSKSGGIQPFGGTVINIADSQGTEHKIAYSEGVSRTLFVIAVLEKDDSFWDNSTETEAKTNVLNYTNDLTLGESVIYEKVRAHLTIPKGVGDIVSLLIGFINPPVDSVNLPVAETEFVETELANIDISWSN